MWPPLTEKGVESTVRGDYITASLDFLVGIEWLCDGVPPKHCRYFRGSRDAPVALAGRKRRGSPFFFGVYVYACMYPIFSLSREGG